MIHGAPAAGELHDTLRTMQASQECLLAATGTPRLGRVYDQDAVLSAAHDSA